MDSIIQYYQYLDFIRYPFYTDDDTNNFFRPACPPNREFLAIGGGFSATQFPFECQGYHKGFVPREVLFYGTWNHRSKPSDPPTKLKLCHFSWAYHDEVWTDTLVSGQGESWTNVGGGNITQFFIDMLASPTPRQLQVRAEGNGREGMRILHCGLRIRWFMDVGALIDSRVDAILRSRGLIA